MESKWLLTAYFYKTIQWHHMSGYAATCLLCCDNFSDFKSLLPSLIRQEMERKDADDDFERRDLKSCSLEIKKWKIKEDKIKEYKQFSFDIPINKPINIKELDSKIITNLLPFKSSKILDPIYFISITDRGSFDMYATTYFWYGNDIKLTSYEETQTVQIIPILFNQITYRNDKKRNIILKIEPKK